MSAKSGELLLLDGLPDAIARIGGVDVVLPEEPSDAHRRLLVTLGARYTVTADPARAFGLGAAARMASAEAASGPRRRVPTVAVIAPAELNTEDCNEYGCIDPATGGRGPDRKKCERHKREANERRAAANRAHAGEFRKSNPLAHPRTTGAKPAVEPKKQEEPSLQGLARDLVPAAAVLERKLAARSTARADAQEAFEEFKARLEALSQAVRTLVA